ncbi:MAG: hypothetical protein J0G29_02770 [Alphaproteobacteria bacterium]|nr:hypothetical protein [Alphaproteobacteria bacterium]OJV46348.1 MAG: hypothetical protein BGO28_03215 [Alphaproteobacteria bacterium 43-37]
MLSRKIKRHIIGIFLLFFGVVGGFLPIIQGWIFISLGLLVLKDDIAFIPRLIRKLKTRFPRTAPAFMKAEEKVDLIMHKWGLK